MTPGGNKSYCLSSYSFFFVFMGLSHRYFRTLPSSCHGFSPTTKVKLNLFCCIISFVLVITAHQKYPRTLSSPKKNKMLRKKWICRFTALNSCFQSSQVCLVWFRISFCLDSDILKKWNKTCITFKITCHSTPAI